MTDTPGKAACRAVVATIPGRGQTVGACPSHDDQPAGRYGGGDLRCTPCRQKERDGR